MKRRTATAGLIIGATGRRLNAAQDTPTIAMLTVAGLITRFTDESEQVYLFTEQQFLSLPMTQITTSTPWTPTSTFEGPALTDVLRIVGATGKNLKVLALNDYSGTLPVSDATRYGVILAHSRDGVRLTPKDFGPIWLMYPRDDHPDELNTPMALARYVWQASRIELE